MRVNESNSEAHVRDILGQLIIRVSSAHCGALVSAFPGCGVKMPTGRGYQQFPPAATTI